MDAISLLPDEVLESILIHIRLMSMTRHDRLPYLLVCKRWTAILEPLLFQVVTLNYGGTKHDRITQFLNFLQLKPYLSKDIRSIALTSQQTDQWIYDQMMRLLDQSPALQHFWLDAPIYDPELPALYNQAVEEKYSALVSRVASLSLRSISLSCMPCDFIVRTIGSSATNCLKIRLLTTEGQYFGQFIEQGGVSIPPSPPHSNMPFRLRDIYYRTGRMKELHLCMATIRLRDISTLLQWPESLETLYLRNIVLMETPTQQDLDDLLQHHSTTLQTLVISDLRIDTSEPANKHTISACPRLDLSQHSGLKQLSLSARNAIDTALHRDLKRLSRSRQTHDIPCTHTVSLTLELLEIRLTEPDKWEMINFNDHSKALVAWFGDLRAFLDQHRTPHFNDYRLKTVRIYESGVRKRHVESLQEEGWLEACLLPARQLMDPVGVEVVYFRSQSDDYQLT